MPARPRSHQGLSIAARMALFLGVSVAVIMVAEMVTLAGLLGAQISTNVDQEYQQLVTHSTNEIQEQLIGLAENQVSMASALSPFAHSKPDVLRVIKALGEKDALPSELDNVSFASADGVAMTSDGKVLQVGDRGYFKAVMAHPEEQVLSPPIVSKATGKPIAVYAHAVLDSQGQTAGCLIYPVKLDSFIETISKIRVGAHGHAWLVNREGTILAYPEAENIMKNVSDAAGLSKEAVNALMAVITGDKASGSVEYTGPQGPVVNYFARLPETPDLMMFLTIARSDAFSIVQTSVNLLYIFLFATLVLMTLVSVLLARSISRPITVAALKFRELSRGDADLTQQMSTNRRDELGSLVLDFNQFVAKLREIVVSLKDSQTSIASISTQLHEAARESTRSLDRVASSLEGAQAKSQAQSQAAESMDGEIAQIAQGIEELDRNVAVEASSVSQASASIEEMARNIDAVARSALQMFEQFKVISTSSQDGLEITTKTTELVGRIASGSENLSQANSIISSIAAQTNLLSMNAAIEAAHAGDAGRGFSVVADEIRKLAVIAANQSRTIGAGIKSLQKDIAEVVESSSRLTSSFDGVNARIQETGKLIEQVSSAMDEQRQGSTEMLEALKSLSQVTESLRTGSDLMRKSTGNLVSNMAKLRGGAEEIAHEMVDIKHTTGSVFDSVQSVARLSDDAQKAVEAMEHSVGRFIV